MNARQIIESAYRKIRVIGRGRAMTSEEAADGLAALNSMLNAWSADDLRVPFFTTETLTLTAGLNPHTIGTGGDLNTAQPTDVKAATIVSGQTSFDLDLMAYDQYAAIPDKTTAGYPSRYYFERQESLGRLYFDYVPQEAFSLRLVSLKALATFAALTTDDSFPNEYEEPVIYNLAIRLAPEYGKEPAQSVVAVAASSLANLERNAAAARVPTLEYPEELLGGRRRFNINAGNY